MIVTDIFGKERNARYFRVEVLKGYGSGEHGKKVAIIRAISTYWSKTLGLRDTEHMIKRVIVTSLSTLDELLALKEDLVSKEDSIQLNVKEFMKQDSNRSMFDEKAYMVEKGYAIYEEDEAMSYDEIR